MLSNQEKIKLKLDIRLNQHELFVVSFEEMNAIVRSAEKASTSVPISAWEKVKGKAEVGASYYASADDLRTLSKLVGDLGGFSANAYVKTYGGKPHIILKGHPGLRRVLTGTKYGIKNPKVITMGLGKAGAVNAAKSGGILSIVLLSAYRVADYVLTDQATLSQLIGSLATDVVKVGIATGASIASASAFVAMGFTIAVGPIAAVIVVGVVTSMALGMIDERYGITDRVIAGLDDIGKDIRGRVGQVKKSIYQNAAELADSIFDYAIVSAKKVVINVARHTINKFISGKPRYQ